MRHFHQFLSTFSSARPEFRQAGRQKLGIFTGFCLLSRPRRPILDQTVDKNQTFPTGFCLLSGPRRPILESQVDKNEAFTPVFVYFRGRTRHD